MYTIQQIEEHLTAMGHGSTLAKIRNKYALYERVANTVMSKIDPITTMRIQPLTEIVHDDVYDYSLPDDHKKPIDLIPQDERTINDIASRQYAGNFDLKKAIANQTISIEGKDGTKYLRVNWKTTPPKVVHQLNSLTANGTVATVGTASNLTLDEIYKYSGSGSARFDVASTGDGIKITDFTDLDLEDWDEIADFWARVYLPSTSNLTSITGNWGDDLTTDYWTSTAQTAQADGTAFKTGWNLIKLPWSSAIETGTVDPSEIDEFSLTFTVTGAISDIRVDNITVSVGRPYDWKYYSSYLFQDSSGTWIKQPTTSSDVLLLDEMGLNIFLNEALIEMAQQMEGEDSGFDISIAERRLNGNPQSSDLILRVGYYAAYRGEYPSQSKKAKTSYYSLPRFNG